jgi:hypothetical protein
MSCKCVKLTHKGAQHHNELQYRCIVTWILHESEASICKTLKGEVIVLYFEPLITQQMEASGSPDLLGVAQSETQRVKIKAIS